MRRRSDSAGSSRYRGFAILLCGILGLLLLIVPAVSSIARGPSAALPSISATATAGESLAASATKAPGEASEEAASPPLELPVAAAPVRISYPAAAVDVAVHPLEPDAEENATQTIDPPATQDGYWLTPYGMPGAGSSDTTYVIGHSWIDRDAPFNHLSTHSTVGDVFEVVTQTGTVRYRVDSIDTYDKDTLKDSPIWDIVPGQLVLISCYTEDPWGTNVAVTATPVQ